MTKNSVFKRIVAMVLCITMVFGSVPVTFAAETDGGYDQVADSSTVHEWNDFFGPNFDNGSLSTENAGLVWTDKSVYTNEDAPNFGSVSIGENNFLVALSAMASNKEIKGYSAIPTDTVFILDLSQSMDNSGYIPSMVTAANDAIDTLLKLNKHNRISVILYSGNAQNGDSNLNHATTVLPLGRYTAEGKNYIEYTGTLHDTKVKTGNTVRKEDGTKITSVEKTTRGGTYIQSGLYLAYKQFESVKNDTVIDNSLIQGGTKRMPIITLMSDGSPTVATTSYTNIETSNHGDGGTNTNTITFLTQLTAAYLKQNVENWYQNDTKFYSLWLKGANDITANGSLQPSASNETLDRWWKTFLAASSGSNVEFSEGRGENKVTFSVTRDNFIPQVTSTNYSGYGKNYEEAWLSVQNYVDAIFNANNSEGLIDAFDDIVNEIILQSKYYPTLVEGGNYNVDGYITIEDPVGELMEVKQIEGIMLAVGNRDVLFTGAALTRYMKEKQFGSSSEYSENGWELIRAIQERLGVNESEAIALATKAWNHKQLSYTSSTEYSNYIGWYCDDNRNYLGFWHEGHTESDRPQNATKIVKSYGFFGEVENKENNLYGAQMLHVVVHVATDIDDGDQLIYFAVPASLIPVMTYSVEVNSNSLSSATSANVSLGGATGPIRLLAEVGLRDDINEVTVAEAIEGHHHHHTDENGNYVFYTNRWGKDDDFEPSSSSILEKAKVAATSHYKPSVQNDRYYYTENAVIYTDAEGKNEYTGSSKPANGTFYHVVYNFNEDGINKKVEAIKAESLEAATKNSDGSWYIPIGTPYRQILTTYTLNKTENKTGTLGYVDDMLIYKNEGNNSYEAYIFNGNNGKITLAPAQGIELTKTVPVVEAGSRTDNFVFNVEFTSGTDMSGIRVLKEDGKTQKTATVSGNTVKVTLAKDETVYMIGIPTGAGYTVTEEEHPIYELDSSSTGLSGTVSEKTINKVSAVNKIKVPGHLVISKTVTHPFGADYVIPAGKKFEIKVDFTVPAEKNLNGVTVSGTDNAVWEGKALKFNVEHGQIVSIANLPDGTTYTITETEIQNDGFTLDATASSGLSGTIKSNETSSAALVNNYTPASVKGEEITVTGTKNLVGREWKAEDSFTFTLSQWNGRNFVTKDVEAGSTENVATSANHDFSLNTAMDEVTFDKAGTYYFWVTEAAATIPGVTYDSTYRLFTVTVSDRDMDGKLEIKEVKGGDGRVRVSEGTNATIKTWNVDVDFTNVYAPDGSAEAEVFIQKEIEKAAGVTASLEGFQFQVYRVEGEEEIPVGSPYTTDQSGFAEIKLVYGPDSLKKTEENGNVKYEPATYTYRIREVAPDEANRIDGMTYTTDYAQLSVTLSDNTVGGIEATTTFTPVNANASDETVKTSGIVIGKDENDSDIIRNGLVFTNTYDLDPEEVVLHGEKTLNGRSFNHEDFVSEEFTFELYKVDGNEKELLQSVKHIAVSEINGNYGRFVFAPLEFSDADVGKEYHYVVEEKGGNLGGITYSQVKYYITVAVTQGTGNDIVTTVSTQKVDNGVETDVGNNILSFVNEYAVSGNITATIEGEKELIGRNIENGEFIFEIVDEEGNITEVSNSGSSFSHTFTYNEPGEYVYTVREKAGNLGGMTYDDSEYYVAVVVSDDRNGKLKAEVQYEEEVIFKNLYTPKATEVTVKGKKVLEGMDLVDGQFKFELYPANENYTVSEGTAPVATATNADGEFGFNFVFDKAGDYYYVIHEDASNPIQYIDYDESEYQVHIVVYDDGKGELQHIVKINEAENGEIVFVNRYEKPKEPPKPERVTKLTVEKVWNDKNDKFGDRPDSVTVVLYANGEKFGRAVLSEENDWSYTFKDLPKNDENGRRIEYTVAEENVPKNYYASYDTTWLGKVIITNTYTEEHNPSTGAPGI